VPSLTGTGRVPEREGSGSGTGTKSIGVVAVDRSLIGVSMGLTPASRSTGFADSSAFRRASASARDVFNSRILA
jgi:hypothetical protein